MRTTLAGHAGTLTADRTRRRICTRMAKAGQHHNSGASSSKPRGHEKARGRNHPDRSQEITTGSYKKPETYRKQAAAHSSNTDDSGRGSTNLASGSGDMRDGPTKSRITRPRASS